MKDFKTEIIEKIVKESEGSKIVSLHDVGVALGHKHLSAQDCRDIISAALKRMPDYRVVKMVAPRTPDCCASSGRPPHSSTRPLSLRAEMRFDAEKRREIV